MVALAGVQLALSRSMQRPETALQVSLFDRQKNKIELNDNGQMAVEYAGRIVGEARDMAARIQAFDRSRRTILVGSCAPAPLWEISQVLADLYRTGRSPRRCGKIRCCSRDCGTAFTS